MKKVGYSIKNNLNGKSYIGTTKCKRAYDRCNGHKSLSSGIIKGAIKTTIFKYGVKNFTLEVMYKVLDETGLAKKETESIGSLKHSPPDI